MTFKQFYRKYEGRAVDIDGAAGVQCCDLIKVGLKDMYNIPYFSFGGAARCLWENYSKLPYINKNFDRIPYGPNFEAKEADIIVWNGNVGKGNGHCAWFMEEDGNSFYSFDQNWSGKAAHKQKHNYSNLYGALRHKKQEADKNTPDKQKTAYFPIYEGNSISIVECLAKVKAGTSYAYRKEIAQANGIEDYRGTMEQNAKLVKLIKKGKLIKP